MEKTTSASKKSPQPEISIGLIGHVDHGKTTLLEKLSGKWTDTHSEEVKRGITIRLGYANTTIYKDPKAKELPFTTDKKEGNEFVRAISFIDAPGHETLMATMLSGAAIMDAALLLVAANEECPQPQTREHLMALDILGLKNIIIVQNKVDLADEEQVKKNYEQIKAFTKGTIAEKAPIIPTSAQHNINIDLLVNMIQEQFPTPKRDESKEPIMFIARSFDINKPGTEISKIHGGVFGGSVKQGKLKINDVIEIRPGLKIEKEGRTSYKPIMANIIAIKSEKDDLSEAHPGGSIAILTGLDPAIVKSDSLIGNVLGIQGKVPQVWEEMTIKPKLLERAVGMDKDMKIEPIKKGEPLMLNVNASATIGTVLELKKDLVKVKLKRPVCATKENRLTISRLMGSRFRLIGIGEIQ